MLRHGTAEPAREMSKHADRLISAGSPKAGAKRLMDLAGGLVGLLAAAPLLCVSAVAIVLNDRGPALFAQAREGHEGRTIRVWKLRTMLVDGDAVLAHHLLAHPTAQQEWETYFRLANDPRTLGRLGRVLRRFSIDELPQFWNVVRGDMSLVGPRPLPAYVLDTLPAEFVRLRRSVRPGLTGLWQVSGRSDGDMAELVRMDTEYLKLASFALDLRILARTPAIVLTGVGAY